MHACKMWCRAFGANVAKLAPAKLLLNECPYTSSAGMGGFNVLGWSIDLLKS